MSMMMLVVALMVVVNNSREQVVGNERLSAQKTCMHTGVKYDKMFDCGVEQLVEQLVGYYYFSCQLSFTDCL